ncbi:MAG: M14 family zinc carboxypeptidase [Actinomycetota bacterium]
MTAEVTTLRTSFVVASAVVAALLVTDLNSFEVEPRRLNDAITVRVRWRVIGRSTDGRRIRAIGIGDPHSSRSVLVVGSIHGNEGAGKKIVKALRNQRPPADLNLWIIPDLNPDGSIAGTRQNGRGVDLNRNFRRGWRRLGERWDTYYSGPRPFSEPESRAARRFIIDVHPDLTIWYHQAMRLVDRTGPGRRFRRRYARISGLPLRPIGPLPGTATRWQNHRFKRDVAFVVELPAGALTWRSARRHTRAVRTVGRMQ